MQKSSPQSVTSYPPEHKTELLQWTSDIVAAYLSKNEINLRDLRHVVDTVYSILSGLGNTGQPDLSAIPALLEARLPRTAQAFNPVAIERSITPEYIVCLEDGVRLKTLKRYLFRKYRLTPEQYRMKWGLPPDYPMVAPNYAAKRSALAKKMGLGRKKRSARRPKK